MQIEITLRYYFAYDIGKKNDNTMQHWQECGETSSYFLQLGVLIGKTFWRAI